MPIPLEKRRNCAPKAKTAINRKMRQQKQQRQKPQRPAKMQHKGKERQRTKKPYKTKKRRPNRAPLSHHAYTAGHIRPSASRTAATYRAHSRPLPNAPRLPVGRTPASANRAAAVCRKCSQLLPNALRLPGERALPRAQICKKPTFLYTFASTRRAMASARPAPSFSTPSRYALSASSRLYSSCTGRSASMTLSATACLNTP